MVITEIGEQVYATSKILFQTAADLRSDVLQSKANKSGIVKIVASTGIAAIILPQIFNSADLLSSDIQLHLVTALSCVDGSFYARVNLSDFDVCRLRSCVRPFDAVDNTAGLDEVRALGPNQISELVSPDSASGCPNFSSF